MADHASIEVVVDGKTRNLTLDRSRSILIACMTGIKIISRAQAWKFHKIPVYEASKLLAFLEHSMKRDFGRSGSGCGVREVIVETPGDLNIWKFERWLIERVMGGGSLDARFFDFLRSQETYGLVRFLLGERLSNKTIPELSERYGVSESHFRRLCKQALGKSLKRELRQWRAATALLDVVEGQQSMTQLAMSHGFASPSHFSQEIKNLFGLSPGQFRRKHKELR
ncbi:AraC family transcriptional regulator [Burkholderia sp. ABCPW 14]|nr:AraC family transcriptional regulator [Burkholderia sp. ABCPW 14]